MDSFLDLKAQFKIFYSLYRNTFREGSTDYIKANMVISDNQVNSFINFIR